MNIDSKHLSTQQPKSKMVRADFMASEDRVLMGALPRTHQNCIEKTGLARPGKTRHERARRINKHD